MTSDVQVALVHDYLTQRGGAERVVLSMLKAFPNAALHTSLYEKGSTFPEFSSTPVRTMALDNVGVLRRNHRLAFPVLAAAFSRLVVEGDVALCSSSGWAHGARVTGRKIVYCYSPARWLYQGNTYLGPDERAARMALAVARFPLLRWDRRMAATATRYLTLSNVVKERIFRAYGIVAEVLPPPPTLDPPGPSTARPGLAPGFFLCVSRLLPYKNVDAIVEAFSTMPDEQLVVVGEGPEGARLARTATSNVTFGGVVDDATLRWLYGNCAGLVAAGFEDFGLTLLEA
ncbi:MAG: glycosyltransferase, partial [Actinomycetota bacterium]|nr:glycosyltransferase [Actinomycetota bacterium]